jgi:serine/threonine-protein phosphatase 2A regulatory subunit B'
MKGLKKTLVGSLFFCPVNRVSSSKLQLNRRDSSSKNKEPKAQPSPSLSAPSPSPSSVPPPNNSKPLPTPGPSAAANLNHHSISHSYPSLSNPFGSRSSSSAHGGYSASDRRYSNAENGPPAPPIVVVSSDPSLEQATRPGLSTPSGRDSLGLDPSVAGGVPSRANVGSRLRPGPKDIISIKPPRKQRSSRFVPTQKVDIERLPPFMGT